MREEQRELGYRGKIVDVGDAQRDQCFLELVCNDLRMSAKAWQAIGGRCTLTSRDEKRCFMMSCAECVARVLCCGGVEVGWR